MTRTPEHVPELPAVVVPPAGPRVVKAMHVTAHHVFWQPVHVFLERPAVLGPEVIS